MKSITKNFFLPPATFFAVAFFLLPLFSSAQTTTRNGGQNPVPSSTSKKTKILLIPWEPRMFNCNSDISHAISSETSQNYDQIEEALRKGMVEEMKHAFGPTCNVISLMDDTAKMKADLRYVYTCTSLSYTPVDFPLNATKADSVKLKAQSGIKKGQVEATDDDVEKFMNTIILSPNLLAYLKKKYGAEYVIFINEVDLDNDLAADPYNYQGKQEFNRIATMHWTIFNSTDGKRIAAGKTNANFLSTINTPKKIIDGSFSMLANAMYTKYLVGIKPKQ